MKATTRMKGKKRNVNIFGSDIQNIEAFTAGINGTRIIVIYTEKQKISISLTKTQWELIRR